MQERVITMASNGAQLSIEGKEKTGRSPIGHMTIPEGMRGVFWVMDGKLLAFPFCEDNQAGIAKSGKTYNHKKLWEVVRPKGCRKPFDYYPRGRVEMSKLGVPILYMSTHVEESIIPAIKAAFNLGRDPVVRYDHSIHYRCHLDAGYKAVIGE